MFAFFFLEKNRKKTGDRKNLRSWSLEEALSQQREDLSPASSVQGRRREQVPLFEGVGASSFQVYVAQMVGQRTRAQWHYTCLSVLATLATVSAGGIPNLADYRSKLSAAAKKNQADTASPVRRRLGECEDAYALCIADSGCASCVSMLSLQDDDDLISSGSCDAITSSSIYACSSLGASSATLLCDLADACVTGDDGDDGSDDDDATGDDDEEEPCPTDACEVAHPSWLGDGWCDYDYGSTRCYNTEACGFDGGDCCEESCVSST